MRALVISLVHGQAVLRGTTRAAGRPIVIIEGLPSEAIPHVLAQVEDLLLRLGYPQARAKSLQLLPMRDLGSDEDEDGALPN